jgi:Domain of unknown function (DUF1338)
VKEFSTLETYLDLMWKDYCLLNPQASNIYNQLVSRGESPLNDHIALRTVNSSHLGIQSLAQHFEKFGYVDRGEYFFKEKKLYAKHYENKLNPEAPKIFISELELEKTSVFVQSVYEKIVSSVSADAIQNPEFVFKGRPWSADHSTYLKLAAESEYASWVYAFGFRPNHFTVSFNHLSGFKSLDDLNTYIKSLGIKLNVSGGEIKGTPQELLEQSSTMASQIPVQFVDGVFEIPGCYYEFARRYELKPGQLYQGFIAQSADKIFESTNRS